MTSANMFSLASAILLAAFLVMVLLFNLLPALFAGLLVLEVVNSMTPPLQRIFSGSKGRYLAVGLLSILVILILGLAFVGTFSLVMREFHDPSALLHKMLGLLDRAREKLPPSLERFVPANVDDIRDFLGGWLREHVADLQHLGARAVHVFVTVLMGMVLGGIVALRRISGHQALPPLASALMARVTNFAWAFRSIVFAQAKISLLNTLLTTFFLLVLLPLFGVRMPLAKTLILVTFIAGLLPVVGNLISNAVILVVGLSVSMWVALWALIYLVLIHKLEYFLNAVIVGGHIKARAWELLSAMLLFEAVFGLPGLIAAPVYYAYVKQELKEQGWI